MNKTKRGSGEKESKNAAYPANNGGGSENYMKRKKTPALLFGGLAVLWVILLGIFPLDFYSLFLMSKVGSNLFLIALAAVITFPANMLFCKLRGADINERRHLLVNEIGMTAVVYTYSAFRFSAVWWVIVSLLLHCIFTSVLFMRSKKECIPKIKEKDSRGRSALLGAVCALLSDFVYMLLFLLALRAMYGNG